MNKTINLQEFIERAKKVHGDRFNYSKVIYKNSHTKVIIICKKHGEFEQIPKTHWEGSICLLCSREESKGRKRTKLNTDVFIEKANIQRQNMSTTKQRY